MAKLTLQDIAAGYGSTTTLNANNALIEAAIENTLSRDGTTPNTMSADIDMNSNHLVNVADPTADHHVVTKGYVDANYGEASVIAAAASAAAAAISETNAATSESAASAAQTAAEAAQTAAEAAAAIIPDPSTGSPGEAIVVNATSDGYILAGVAGSATNTFVNAADGGPYASAVTFDGTLPTVATWESIGPTGSGASHIWTALDSVPSDADWIEVHALIFSYVAGGTASVIQNQEVHVRKNGSSVGFNWETMLVTAAQWSDALGNAAGAAVNVMKIPVNSRVFDYYRSSSFGTSVTIQLQLTGWGYNP